MPVVVNGFGTWNHGRRNTISAADFCEHCGRFGFLSSYDTRTFITAVYLPIIPLGKKRILNHCPACNKFRQAPLAEWITAGDQARANARETMQDRLNDAGAVAAMLRDLIGVQDRATFESIGGRVAEVHAANAEILRLLGTGYGYFGRPEAAEKCYLASLKAADSVEAREGLAFAYLQLRRPREAAPYLRHVLEQADAGKAWLLYFLIEGLQGAGSHDEALALVEGVFRRFPALERDKTWKALRKVALKHQGSTKPLLKGVLTKPGKPLREQSPKKAVAAGALVVALLITLYLVLAVHEGRSRTVHVVNGLDRQYRVTIGGQDVTLPPAQPVTIELSEGTHAIHAADLGLPQESVEIRTNFFARPFRDEVVVINPDHVALVVWEETEYMENVDDSAKYNYKIHTNSAVHAFPDVDYPFEEFPEEIRMDGSREMRTRVSEIEVAPEDFASALYGQMDDEVYLRNLAARFHLSPRNVTYLEFLATLMETDAFLTEIKGELARRPVEVDVHRFYQQVVDTVQPDHDLEGEYARLLAEEPSNADLQYLAGRATRDYEKATACLREAAASSSAHAHAALAFGALTGGNFEEASREIDAALEIAPKHTSFIDLRRTIWLAQRNFDAYLAALPKDAAGLPADYPSLDMMVRLMGERGDSPDTVQALIGRTLSTFERSDGALEAAQRKSLIESFMTGYEYARGKEGYLARIQGDDEPATKLELAMINGDAQSAIALAETIELEMIDSALVYLLASERGMTEAAEAQLTRAADELAKSGGWETRELAGALTGAKPASGEQLVRVSIPPAQKRVFLAVLAARFPEDRDRYLRLARTLNFERYYPYHILDGYLTRAGF